jgi:drug/metabolite transporter (DMT)-like permease
MEAALSLVFAFSAMVFWGIGDSLIQKTTRKIGDMETLAYIGALCTLMLLPVALPEIHLLSDSRNFLLVLALGIVTFIAAMFNFESLKQGKLSVVDVVLEFELPVTIALGFFFFGERLSLVQLGIILLIFVGIVLIAARSFSHFAKKIERGVFLALIGSTFMGVVNFLTATTAKTVSPIMAVWADGLIFTSICFVVILKREGFSKFISNGIKFKWLILAMGVFDTLAWMSYSFSVLKQKISLITAITESYPAVAMIIGVYFNNEKIRWHQYLGAVLALSASFLLAMTV